MNRVDNTNYLDTGGKRLFQEGTVIPADWANSIQEEICKVIDEAGIVLDKNKFTQLYEAIVFLCKFPVPVLDADTSVPAQDPVATPITYGYFGGGATAINTSTTEIDSLRFQDEASVNTAAVLAVARWYLAGANSSIRGYWSGGAPSVNVGSTEIDGIRFDTQAAINPAAVLTLAIWGQGGVNSSTNAFFAGGWRPSVGPQLYMDRFHFANETVYTTLARLAVARHSVGTACASTMGYFAGGTAALLSTEIDAVRFSDEASRNPLAALSLARSFVAGVNSNSYKGYFAGGWTGVQSQRIDVLIMPTETVYITGTTLVSARNSLAGVNTNSYGYFAGGSSVAAFAVNEIDGIDFTTEVSRNPSATLAVARMGMEGIQSGGFL